MGVGAGLYMYVVVVQKFTFAISSPDEFLSSMWALRGLPLPGCLLTLPVSRNYLNSLVTPHFAQLFSGNSSVNLFAVYPFKYKLFVKILSSSLNTMLIVDKRCSDVCCDDFPMPQIDHRSK